MPEEQKQTPFIYCVHGCYTVGYDAEVGYFPRFWEKTQEREDWRAFMHVGYFQLTVLAFPTYAEALTFIGEQP